MIRESRGNCNPASAPGRHDANKYSTINRVQRSSFSYYFHKHGRRKKEWERKNDGRRYDVRLRMQRLRTPLDVLPPPHADHDHHFNDGILVRRRRRKIGQRARRLHGSLRLRDSGRRRRHGDADDSRIVDIRHSRLLIGAAILQNKNPLNASGFLFVHKLHGAEPMAGIEPATYSFICTSISIGTRRTQRRQNLYED